MSKGQGIAAVYVPNNLCLAPKLPAGSGLSSGYVIRGPTHGLQSNSVVKFSCSLRIDRKQDFIKAILLDVSVVLPNPLRHYAASSHLRGNKTGRSTSSVMGLPVFIVWPYPSDVAVVLIRTKSSGGFISGEPKEFQPLFPPQQWYLPLLLHRKSLYLTRLTRSR